MDADEHAARARSFGGFADDYARYRPDYPDAAVSWLVGERPSTVLELGAGTGKLTRSLCAMGHRVIATEPDGAMLAHLRTTAPDAVAVASTAERIPLSASSVDVIVAGQAAHWFDPEHAWAEIARVLRPGGALALVWNSGDIRVPWVRKVLALVDSQRDRDGWDPFGESEVFELSDKTSFKHWQTFRLDTLRGFVTSSSKAATSSASDRTQMLDAATALYESYGRGPDGLLMPWVAHCFRGKVAGLDAAAAEATAMVAAPSPEDETVVISFS